MDQQDAASNMAANLQAALEIRGWNQSDLARETGQSTMNISRFVRGLRIPSADVAIDLARVLGLTVEQLFLPPAKKSRQTA